MKTILGLVMLCFCAALASAADLPKTKADLFGLPPDISGVKAKAKSPDVKGSVCDVWGYADGDIVIGQNDVRDGGVVVSFMPAVPWEDVQDNHRRGVIVLDAISKRQDKGGPYSVEIGEFRRCDGGSATKITDGSIEARGLTLKGVTEIVDVMLEQARQVNNDRYKKRAAKGDKFAHDHAKAPKSRRDDQARKVRD